MRIVVLVAALASGVGGPGAASAAVVRFPDENLEAAVRDALGKPTGDVTTEDMETLVFFVARERRIKVLDGLEYATNLWRVDLGENEISDLSPLASLERLAELRLPQNEISDLSPLSGLGGLRVLELCHNQVDGLGPLSGLANLMFLTLDGNEISDIAPLSELLGLASLRLNQNRIMDISPLVANSDAGGLGEGDRVELRSNYLDLAPGAQALADVEVLVDRGVEVEYEPQRELGAVPPGAMVRHGPQPVRAEGCVFWIDLPGDAVEATLSVFSVDRVLLSRLELDPTLPRYPPSGRWRPRDDRGRRLGTGLYLYLVEVRRADGSVTHSAVETLVIRR